MRILDRYLLRNFLGPFFYCTILFSFLFIIVDGFNHLDDFLMHHVQLKLILSYYAYLLPALLVQIVPVATLVSVLYVLGNLSRHNEIIALKASGMSAFQILSPYLFMGILISFSILLVNETVVPKSAVTSTAIMEGLILKGKKNLKERAIKNVTLYGARNRIIFAREFEILTQTLYDVTILEDNTAQVLQSKLVAKKAHYEEGRWVFYDSMKYELDTAGNILGDPVYSQRRVLDLEEKPEDFIKEASQIEFMSAKQLKDYIERLKGSSQKLIQRLWVDFHYKVSLPFISFIVMLLGAPLAMKSKRGSTAVGVGTSIAIIFIYYGMDLICLALGKGGHLPPFLSAWFSNFVFALVGIYLIRNTA